MKAPTPSTIIEDPFIASNPYIDERRAKNIISDLKWNRAEDGSAQVKEWGCLEVRKNADIANALDKLDIDWSAYKDKDNFTTFSVKGLENLAKLKQAGAQLTGNDLAHVRAVQETQR